MPSRRLRVLVALVLALVASIAVPSYAEPPPLTTWPYRTGYIAMADGTQLRYTVYLPAATGSFPVVMQYDGYAAGSNPYENGQDLFGPRMLAKGYAVLGVNIRGTGCSSGTFDMFEHQWALDGYAAVEWAATQPWSNGDIGMFGVSMPAIMSLYVGALRPPHLRAIAPAAALTDLYRDVAYPGGIYNQSFAAFWTAAQKAASYQDPPLVVADDRDPACLVRMTGHNAAGKVVYAQAQTHPYADVFWPARSLDSRIADVDVPVLSLTSWQDEQVGSRVVDALKALDPATSWHVVTNGNHGTSVVAPDFADLQEEFFDFYVGGVANGFDTTPHIQVWHELQTPSYQPRWVTTHATWPVPSAVTYGLTSGGGLTTGTPATSSASFAYPAPGASMPAMGSDTETAPYKAPGHGVTFTTGAFAAPVELFGPASADIWLSSTASDTDVQVMLSEVRADGQETFVQRGWLRASHRALDASSTALRPVHPHSAAAQVALTPGVPAQLRIEVWPSGHVFRAGSRLRLTVEAPTGVTGFRALQILPGAAVNTVHTGPATPSRLVVGTVPAAGVVASYPACDSLVNQPCR